MDNTDLRNKFKYYKYKAKYLALLEKIKQQKGGDPDPDRVRRDNSITVEKANEELSKKVEQTDGEQTQ